MNAWFLFYFILLLVLGVIVYMATDKVRKEVYNPYFLKPMMIFFGISGIVFLVSSFWYLFQL